MPQTPSTRHAAKRPQAPRSTPITLAVGLLALATAAQAQTTPKPTEQLDAVVVSGIRRSLETAVTFKRNAEGVVEAIAAEDLGKTAGREHCRNPARLPGLTGQRGADGRVDKVSIAASRPSSRACCSMAARWSRPTTTARWSSTSSRPS